MKNIIMSLALAASLAASATITGNGTYFAGKYAGGALGASNMDYCTLVGPWVADSCEAFYYTTAIGMGACAYDALCKRPTSDSYCVAVGARAMSGSTQNDHCTAIGVNAMRDTDTDFDIVAIGQKAGAATTNCTDCIFIGREAGKGMTNETGAVVIGDVLVHTNGVTTIKGFPAIRNDTTNTVSVGFALYFGGNSLFEHTEDRGWLFYGKSNTSDYSSYAQSIHTTSTTGFNYLSLCEEDGNGAIELQGDTDHGFKTAGYISKSAHITFEDGQLCVYTNGVKAGTLSFTPAQ